MRAISGFVVSFVFGVSMLVFGCTAAQKSAVASTYQNVVGPTTRAVSQVADGAADVSAVTPPGTPINSIAMLVMTVSGAILALEKIVSPIVAKITGSTQPNSGGTIAPTGKG